MQIVRWTRILLLQKMLKPLSSVCIFCFFKLKKFRLDSIRFCHQVLGVIIALFSSPSRVLSEKKKKLC